MDDLTRSLKAYVDALAPPITAEEVLARGNGSASARNEEDEDMVDVDFKTGTPSTGGNRRFPWKVVAGLAVAAAAVVGLVLVVTRDDEDGGAPADGGTTAAPATTVALATTMAPATTSAPATTALPTTTVAPTTTLPPLSDEEIATAILLKGSEYGPGWTQTQEKGPAWGFDVALARAVPGCAPYLDAVFGAPSREAGTAVRWFYHPAPDEAMSQYAVVFPDEAGAQAMFDAISSDAFRSECSDPVAAVVPPPDGIHWGLVAQHRTPPSLDLAGDEVALTRAYGSYIRDSTGDEVFEDLLSAKIRVGRIVMVLEGGDPVNLTYEQFQAAVAKMVERAEAALAGQPLS